MDIEKIRIEARSILDKFGKELENVKISSNLHVNLYDDGTRGENDGKSCDLKFRTAMLKNAPKKDDECIILEKGAWT